MDRQNELSSSSNDDTIDFEQNPLDMSTGTILSMSNNLLQQVDILIAQVNEFRGKLLSKIIDNILSFSNLMNMNLKRIIFGITDNLNSASILTPASVRGDNELERIRSVASIEEKPAKNNEPCGHAVTRCSICLDMYAFNEILSTICGHIFCEPCITRAIELRKRCPMCNRAVDPNEIHPIFIVS